MGIATYAYNRSTSGGEIIRELVNASDGQGLHFDGAGYVNLTNAAGAEFGTSDFSLEFIIDQDGDNTNDNYIFYSHLDSNSRIYIYNDISANEVILTFINSSGSSANYTLAYDMAADYGTPTHYVLSADRSSNLVLYKNGNSVASVSIAASSTVDIGASNTAVGVIGSQASGYSVIGTFYRFRTWNKALTQPEVTATYENATVPFADQYGSQTEMIANGTFTGGTTGWVLNGTAAYGTNDVDFTGDSSSSNWVRNTFTAAGAYQKNYLLTYEVTANTLAGAGASLKFSSGGAVIYNSSADITSTVGTHEFEFVSNNPTGTQNQIYLGLNASATGGALTLDNVSIKAKGAVSDYDLAFANPTQSLMVQDRAGAADGTLSATGVTQVTKIEAVNTNKLNVGGTTPRVGIGLAAGVTPSAPLHAYHNTTGEYVAIIDQDEPNAGHGLKVTSDGNGAGTNVLEVESGSTSLLRVLGDGKVGISTSAPPQKLSVVGASSADTNPGIFAIGTDATMGSGTNMLTMGVLDDNYVFIQGTKPGHDTRSLVLQKDGGNVGIGPVSPTFTPSWLGSDTKLLVSGAAGGGVFIERTASTARRWGMGVKTDGSYIVSDDTGGTAPFTIFTDGEAFVGATDQGVSLSGGTAGTGAVTGINAARNAYKKLVLNALDHDIKTSGTSRLTIDSAGLTTVKNPGWPLKNEISNSGFDVWSNATLENVATIEEDDCASDDTGDWTVTRTALAFDTDHYEYTPSGGTNSAVLASASVTAGKLYEISVDIKNGVGSTSTLQLYFYDGAIQKSPTISTTGSFVTHTFCLEVATTTGSGQAGLYDATHFASDIEMKNFSFKEVTPGTVGSGHLAFDTARRDNANVSLWRQHNDGGTYTKDGSFYALKAATSTATTGFSWPKVYGGDDVWNQKFAGRTVTFGAWIKTDQASNAKLRMTKDTYSTETVSAYHTGDNNWQWLEATMDCGASPTGVCFTIQLDGAGDGSATSTNLTYISQPTVVLGSAIGAGNYSRPSGEVIWFEKRVNSNNIYATGFSDVAFTTLNTEADSNGAIPKGAKAIHAEVSSRDSGSATTNAYFATQTNSSASTGQFSLPYGKANDTYDYAIGPTPCNSDGDFEYRLEASGSGTLDAFLAYYGVELR